MKHTTLCYIENDGKYLMLHRTKKANDPNEGKWIGVGGHVEPDETPEQCILREVKEETGLTLKNYRACGEILFDCKPYPPEMMHLYHSDEFEGELIECNEGDLVWIEKEKLRELPAWEGDIIFLDLMEQKRPYFKLDLHYASADKLESAVLDGKVYK